MRLRIVLPKVNPEAIAVPTERVYAGCGGRMFHLRQEVTKALRDTVYHEVQAQCHVSCYEVQSGVPTFFTPKIPAKKRVFRDAGAS